MLIFQRDGIKEELLQIFKEPWPHLIIDNYLDEDTFLELKHTIENSFDDPHTDINTKFVPCQFPEMADLKEHFDINLNLIDDGMISHYSLLQANDKHKNIHTDYGFKIMTCILYISDNNIGTRLYKDKDGSPVAIVDWKPNRLVCFKPTEETFHDVVSDVNDRYAYLFFLIDKDKTNIR